MKLPWEITEKILLAICNYSISTGQSDKPTGLIHHYPIIGKLFADQFYTVYSDRLIPMVVSHFRYIIGIKKRNVCIRVNVTSPNPGLKIEDMGDAQVSIDQFPKNIDDYYLIRVFDLEDFEQLMEYYEYRSDWYEFSNNEVDRLDPVMKNLKYSIKLDIIARSAYGIHNSWSGLKEFLNCYTKDVEITIEYNNL